MLHVVTWKWHQPNFREVYTDEHVNIISQMVRRFTTKRAVRVHCVTDEPHGIWEPTKCHQLWSDFDQLPNVTGRHLPSCYRRLKLFDIPTQQSLGILKGDRVCSLDLDSIILQPLDELWDRLDQTNPIYTGWGVRGVYHQTVYNGSFWSFTAGNVNLQKMWSSFDPKESPRNALTDGFLGSDQGWLSLNFARDTQAYPIRFPEFASYPRDVRKTGVLDRRTKILFFHGARKPWHREEFTKHPWINKVWRTQP